MLSKDIIKHRILSMKRRVLRIKNSDLEVKSYLLADILQAVLLIFSVVYALQFSIYTSGEVFTIITYIIMLNESVCDFNELGIEIDELKDIVTRLAEDSNEF